MIETVLKIEGAADTGKTRKLLEAASKNHGIVICHSPAHMEEKAKCYGLYGIKTFMTYEDLILEEPKDPCYVDEITKVFPDPKADKLTILRDLCRKCELQGYTHTIEETR